ncbi:UPF0481 protein At3g47200-like [Aristolochia californica]|uniref:UPF0481 protein At3g47200-like n=1 Tax=Aristolochia californica TaxID=171875 RepID=UPI0035DAE4BB
MSTGEGDDGSWMIAMKNKYSSSNAEQSHPELPTIVRVPHIIRRTNEEAYEPEILSIGPYHRENKRLLAMEKKKWKYLRDFCSRNEGLTLDEILNSVQELKKSARRCYSEDIPIGEDEFGEMLVLDGCFILELFLKSQERKSHVEEKKLYETDLIFASSSEWILRCVARDLLLAENQLPFFVLLQLFNSFAKTISSVSLVSLSVNFFKTPYYTISKAESSIHRDKDKKSFHPEESSHLHLLHLVHSHFMVTSDQGNDPVRNFDSSRSLLPLVKQKHPFDDHRSHRLRPLPTVPSAKRLQDAGIKFKRRKGGNFLDIKFENGVMEISHVLVDNYTNTFLRNLIAFEQANPALGKCFTFYAAFMDFIVNTAEDVEILHQSGIIDHGLGSEKNIALMFNMMSKGLIVESDAKDKYQKLTRDIMKYYKTPWNMWRAKLNRDYFGNPWAIVSLAAGILAICLAITNTFFGIYRYYHPLA